ncbi:hypothetical protein SHO565_77450 [Streptomyces sp. HO565]
MQGAAVFEDVPEGHRENLEAPVTQALASQSGTTRDISADVALKTALDAYAVPSELWHTGGGCTARYVSSGSTAPCPNTSCTSPSRTTPLWTTPWLGAKPSATAHHERQLQSGVVDGVVLQANCCHASPVCGPESAGRAAGAAVGERAARAGYNRRWVGL